MLFYKTGKMSDACKYQITVHLPSFMKGVLYAHTDIHMTEIFEDLLKNMNIFKRKYIYIKTHKILYMIEKFMDPLKLILGPQL